MTDASDTRICESCRKPYSLHADGWNQLNGLKVCDACWLADYDRTIAAADQQAVEMRGAS